MACDADMTASPQRERGRPRSTYYQYNTAVKLRNFRTCRGETAVLSRRWVVWHLPEHDPRRGSELLLTLGMHGLPTSDI